MELIKDREDKKMSYAELAKKYNVAYSSITGIVKQKNLIVVDNCVVRRNGQLAIARIKSLIGNLANPLEQICRRHRQVYHYDRYVTIPLMAT